MKFEEQSYKLIQDHATIKEAFIIDELQAYMDLKDPSNPKWIQPVRVRLQEKKDWEQKVKEAITRCRKIVEDEYEAEWGHRRAPEFDDLLEELGLEDL